MRPRLILSSMSGRMANIDAIIKRSICGSSCAQVYIYIFTCVNACTDANADEYTHANTDAYTYTNTHTHSYAYTHTYIHTHTYIYIYVHTHLVFMYLHASLKLRFVWAMFALKHAGCMSPCWLRFEARLGAVSAGVLLCIICKARAWLICCLFGQRQCHSGHLHIRTAQILQLGHAGSNLVWKNDVQCSNKG